MKKLAALLVAVAMVVAVFAFAAPAMAAGFDQYGYNRTARIFVGTYNEFLAEQGAGPVVYGDDLLVMKWNAEWDRGVAENWTKPPYAAWETNEWNGAVPGGSGQVWHYKIIWVGSGLETSSYWRDGGYAVWGQFETIMDQGTDAGVHTWFAHAIPMGFGGPR